MAVGFNLHVIAERNEQDVPYINCEQHSMAVFRVEDLNGHTLNEASFSFENITGKDFVFYIACPGDNTAVVTMINYDGENTSYTMPINTAFENEGDTTLVVNSLPYSALAPVFKYDARKISPGVDLTLTGVGTPNLTATYTDTGSGGGTAKATSKVSISYTNIKWYMNPDTRSILVSGNISGANLVRTYKAASSEKQAITAWFNNVVTFYQEVTTGSSGTYDLNIPNTFVVSVEPLEVDAYPASIHFKNDNMVSTARPDEFALGILITNPNAPDYRPGQIKAGTIWRSHDKSGGSAHIRSNNGWIEMRTVSGTGNPPLIRKNGSWVNQSKIGQM